MDLQAHYDQLYKASLNKISCDNYEIDPWIDSDRDDRFGLSLVIRPSEAVKNNIRKFLDALHRIEPNHYYYPNSDIHITVISVISCYGGLKLSQIETPAYVELIAKCIQKLNKTTISFTGVTASPSCIMIQGFPMDPTLNAFREQLRLEFKKSELEQSLDERYLIQTAHATVFRFSDILRDKETFLKVVEKYRTHDFGTFEVDEIELVYNDWYHREESRKTLHTFELQNNRFKEHMIEI